MLRVQTALCFVIPLAIAPLGSHAFSQEAAARELPAPTVLVDTSAMDQEVVAVLAQRIEAVEQANRLAGEASGEGLAAAHEAAGQAQAELGLAYEANTMWTPAQECYGHAISLIAKPAQWRYRLGVCQLALGDPETALESFREASKDLAGTAVVQARLGDTALLLGLVEEAGAAWQAAIDSEAKLEKPFQFAECRVGLAQVRLEEGNLEASEALLREALELKPGYGHAHHLLGVVLAEQGNDEDADFQLLLGKNSWPTFPPDPHTPRLAAYTAGYGRRMMAVENMMQSGQIPNAMQALQVLAQERPQDHFVLNLMARALTFQGQLDQAHQALLSSEQVNPTAQDTKVELAINLFNRANRTQDPEARAGLLEQASAKILEAIQVAPLRGRPWYFRGLIEMQRIGQVDTSNPEAAQAAQAAMQAATQYLQRAHKLGCQEPQLYEQLARIYAQMGRTRDMVRFAELGANIAPQSPNTWMFLTQAYLTVERHDDALTALSRAEAVAKNNPQLVPQVADFAGKVRQAISQARGTEGATKQPAPNDNR